MYICGYIKIDNMKYELMLLLLLLCCGLRSQSTSMAISRRSLNLTTPFLGRLRPKRLTSTKVHIHPPVTDNCPTWGSGRERMAVESISWLNIHEIMFCLIRGSNPWPSARQSEADPTELAGLSENDKNGSNGYRVLLLNKEHNKCIR